MGVDCFGWIEVQDPATPNCATPRNPDWWSGVIRIHDIVDRDYDAYGYFFDVVRRRETAIAAGLETAPIGHLKELVDRLAPERSPFGSVARQRRFGVAS